MISASPDQGTVDDSQFDTFKTAPETAPEMSINDKGVSVFNKKKKFKIRLTSKETGRKIDLNLTYNKEHIITPEEEELRNLQTEPTYNWWDLFSSWFGS